MCVAMNKKVFSRHMMKFWGLCVVLLLGFLWPQNMRMPVEGARAHDYNENSFWHGSWGKSGTHKGIDIFARTGVNVLAATEGLVLFSGQLPRGGNAIFVLGPKWRLHYYSHMKSRKVSAFSLVKSGEGIGTVGETGNAAGKMPHLHYEVITVVPYPWRIDGSEQGWKKMFYLNPQEQLQRG